MHRSRVKNLKKNVSNHQHTLYNLIKTLIREAQRGTHFISDYFNCACLLGVRFFQQSRPKLIGMCRLQKRQPVVNGRKSVVDQHFHPFATPPQTKPENAAVLLVAGK